MIRIEGVRHPGRFLNHCGPLLFTGLVRNNFFSLIFSLFFLQASFSLASSSPLLKTPDWIGKGENPGDDYGFKIAWAGDVFGDGYDDVLVSAPGYDHNRGKVYLYRGGPDGLSKDPIWTAVGEAQGDEFGTVIGGAGDLNGDGYADIFIDSATHNSHSWKMDHAGKLYVYYGGPQGFSQKPSWEAEGDAEWGDFGDFASGVGDTTGWGYCDLLVGAYNWDHARGKVRMYYGGPDGLEKKPSWEEMCLAPFRYLALPAGSTNDAKPYWEKSFWHMSGESMGDQLGYDLGPAGDVRGMGLCDILVGAKYHKQNAGTAYLFQGSPEGVHGGAVWTADGEKSGDNLARMLFSAGDINGDGFGDVVVGAPGSNEGAGAAYIFQGGPRGLPVKPNLRIQGEAVDHTFGYSVACAGDVNGSGYSSVIVGAPGSISGTGRAFLYLGSEKGLSPKPVWVTQGEAVRDRYGEWVTGVGSVTGDGYEDVMVGAGGNNNITGKAYLYMGNGDRRGPLSCPGQFKTDGHQRIGPMGMAGPGLAVVLKLKAKSPVGPCKVKLQAELKPMGRRFDGTGLVNSPQWTVIGPKETEVELACSALKPKTAYRWRIRLIYASAQFNHGQTYSRWLKPSYALLEGGCYFRTPEKP